MKIIYKLISLLLLWFTYTCYAQPLMKSAINDDDILLLDVKVDGSGLAQSIEAYNYKGHTLMAIEPLFDSLKLRYLLAEDQLTLYKGDELFSFPLASQPYDESQIKTQSELLEIWATDGFYRYIELQLLEKIFDVVIETDFTQQLTSISTDNKRGNKGDKNVYLFPVQQLQLLAERRHFDRIYNRNSAAEVKRSAITINDQYRLFTPPHGRVAASADLEDQYFNGSVQLVSDLLYHSANLTLSDTTNTELAASMSLSRYKLAPEERIFSLFDSYTFGDVSGVANNLTTTSNSGVGVVFRRAPKGYRRKNLETTIDEIAPPGWDAELFHNGVFLENAIVPNDGRLVFENQPLDYGINAFEVRLYGPYGEEEIIKNDINVKQNALGQGQLAYNINVLDKNHNLINDPNREGYSVTNFGSSINYGVTDQWQLGFSYASLDDEQKLYSIKNALSFENMVIESDVSVDQGKKYAQLTSLSGSLFNNSSYSLLAESAENFESETIDTKDDELLRFGGAYIFNNTTFLSPRFSVDYRKKDDLKTLIATNQLSKRLWGVSLSHTFTYTGIKQDSLATTTLASESMNGSFLASGKLFGVQVSGNVNYDPKSSDPILDSSSITLRKSLKDSFNNNHYLTARYRPLFDMSNRWELRHRAALDTGNYQLTYSSSYDSNEEWELQLGIRFFLGYDYHHNKIIMDSELSSGSATLDVHSYLDRHANGEPDVLDYNLEGVSYSGNRQWKKFESGKDGRTILPGVYANSEFGFQAKWQEGSATINNDYVVYTHPGAYVDVNMPFYLITDLTGFVVRHHKGEEIGLRNVTMQLLDENNEVLKTVETDQDGYYEFLQLAPNTYNVQISEDYLQTKGFTSDVTGVSVATSGRGGFVELPILVLRRVDNKAGKGGEANSTFILDEDNVDALVWDENVGVNQNYFTLPQKGSVVAKHSLSEESLDKQVGLIIANTTNTFPNLDEIAHEDNEVDSEDAETTMVLNKALNDDHLNELKSSQEPDGGSDLLPRLKMKVIPLATEKINVKPISAKVANASAMTNNDHRLSPAYDLSGWSIQFVASKAKMDNARVVKMYSEIGKLFVGGKVSSSGGAFYCVISQSFSSKQAARDALAVSGLKGWVTQSKNYSAIESIN